jgi:hypothetical protein
MLDTGYSMPDVAEGGQVEAKDPGEIISKKISWGKSKI